MRTRTRTRTRTHMHMHMHTRTHVHTHMLCACGIRVVAGKMIRSTVPSKPGADPAYQVRTEPLLRNLRDEVVDSCEYAFQADHVSTHGGMTLESGAAPRGGGGGVLVLGATAAVLVLAAHSRRTVL